MPLSTQLLLWGVPVCLTLHNLEEGLGVAELVPLLRGMFPWFRLTARAFLLALVALTAIVWMLALLLPAPERSAMLLGVQAVLLFNAFVPHVWLSLRLRRYTPGVATAVLLVVPYSIYLFSHTP